MSGYSEKELIGKKPNIVKSNKENPEKYKDLWETILNGKNWKGEFLNLNKNGDEYWVKQSISPIRDKNGKIKQYISISHDITKEKKLEKDKRFVESLVIHDLKSPISNIILLSNFILETCVDNDKKEIVENILENANKANQMINSSLDMFKIEEEHFKLIPERIFIKDMIKRVKKNLFQFNLNRLKINSKIKEMCGNKVLIETMILNLLLNSFEADDSNDPINICFDIKDNQTYIEIKNTNVVPKEIRKDFFSKYITSGKTKGTGLGTYDAKKIIESHNGKIWFEIDEKNNKTILKILISRIV